MVAGIYIDYRLRDKCHLRLLNTQNMNREHNKALSTEPTITAAAVQIVQDKGKRPKQKPPIDGIPPRTKQA